MTFSKKQTILFYCLLIFIFSSLLVVATFYDVKISDILAKNGLVDGNYFSKYPIPRLFEIIGEMPSYLFGMTACAIIFVRAKRLNIKWFRIFAHVSTIVGGYFIGFFGWYKLTSYIYKFHPDTLDFLNITHSIPTLLFIIVLDAIVLFLFIDIIGKINDEIIDQLIPFAIIVLFSLVFAYGTTEITKRFVGRERYRTIYYFDNNLALAGKDQGFTKWYIANGNPSKIADSFNISAIGSDYFKSFPSGHVTSCGITYTLMALPFTVKKLSTKKWKCILIITPILVTGLVAFERIRMGAHFLSDVLFGGTIAFVAFIGVCYLYKYVLSKLVKKFFI